MVYGPQGSHFIYPKTYKILLGIWSSFGFPKIIQSDNGTEFVNTILSHFTKVSNIDHRLITAYHPRADGLVEKWVDLTKRTLRKSINADLSSWEKHVILSKQ